MRLLNARFMQSLSPCVFLANGLSGVARLRNSLSARSGAIRCTSIRGRTKSKWPFESEGRYQALAWDGSQEISRRNRKNELRLATKPSHVATELCSTFA